MLANLLSKRAKLHDELRIIEKQVLDSLILLLIWIMLLNLVLPYCFSFWVLQHCPKFWLFKQQVDFFGWNFLWVLFFYVWVGQVELVLYHFCFDYNKEACSWFRFMIWRQVICRIRGSVAMYWKVSKGFYLHLRTLHCMEWILWFSFISSALIQIVFPPLVSICEVPILIFSLLVCWYLKSCIQKFMWHRYL